MACKIAESSTVVQPIIWAPVQAAVPPSKTSPVTTAVTMASDPAESERRQAELAQCRKIAFEEGSKKAREQAKVEIANANDRLAQALRDLVALKRRIRNEAEADVVKLSLAVARRILHRELSADPDSIQGIVYAGLQRLQKRDVSNVRISPAALDSVRTALEKVGLIPEVSIISDPKLRSGDIIFETTLGELDASVESQLQEIERGFADRLGSSC